MRSRVLLRVLISSVLFALAAPALVRGAEPAPAPSFAPVGIYPAIEPYRTGFLKVSAIHEVYYELSGNPQGAPVFILHGGPGGGIYPDLRRYHDPSKWLIVTYDQRGAGKSKPHCELRENTTADLVGDIEKLRQHLGIGRLHLFGGSWGSTLALAYAEAHPRQVASLVLRGIFLGMREEIDHFYHGGAGAFFPEAYARLQSVMPHPEKKDYPQQLLKLLRSDDAKVKKNAAREWVRYEAKLAQLTVSDEQVESDLPGYDVEGFALLENHYMASGCFFKEGQLLDGAAALAGIPTIIVHGRYDVICRPAMAYRLHQSIPGSRLVIVEGVGHSGGSPQMRAALVSATRAMEQTALPSAASSKP